MRNRSHSISLEEDEEQNADILFSHVSPEIHTKEMFTEFKVLNDIPHSTLTKNRRQSLIGIEKSNEKVVLIREMPKKNCFFRDGKKMRWK